MHNNHVTAVELYNNAYICLYTLKTCIIAKTCLLAFLISLMWLFVWIGFVCIPTVGKKGAACKKMSLKSNGKGLEKATATCFSWDIKLMFKILNKLLEFNIASSQLRSSWLWRWIFVKARGLQESNYVQ